MIHWLDSFMALFGYKRPEVWEAERKEHDVMKHYVIPDGWNRFDVKPKEGAHVSVMDSDGIVGQIWLYSDKACWDQRRWPNLTSESQTLLMNRWVCWKHIEPLQCKEYNEVMP